MVARLTGTLYFHPGYCGTSHLMLVRSQEAAAALPPANPTFYRCLCSLRCPAQTKDDHENDSIEDERQLTGDDKMKIETPQILWHNGSDSDNGKAAPIYSCSLLPVGDGEGGGADGGIHRHLLATVGNTPEVHIWEIGLRRGGGRDGDSDINTCKRILQSSDPQGSSGGGGTVIKHVLSLGRQIDRSLNAVRFSPDGRHLAAAGDGGAVLVFSLPPCNIGARGLASPGSLWAGLADEKELSTQILPSPSTEDAMDLTWSPDSGRIAVACLDHAVVVYENVRRGDAEAKAKATGTNPPALQADAGGAHSVQSQPQPQQQGPKWVVTARSSSDHTGYVQGVSFDPKGLYLASQGSDRTVRVWGRGGKAGRGGAAAAAASSEEATAAAEAASSAAEGPGQSPLCDSSKASTNANASIEATRGVGAIGTETASATAAPPMSEGDDAVFMRRARADLAARRLLAESKLELGRAKVIKFRETAAPSATATASTPSDPSAASGGAASGEGAVQTNPNPAPAPARRSLLFADESTVESFFRRLAWTADGAYLICPSALWKHPAAATAGSSGGGDAGQVPRPQGPSYATCLFARHSFEQPCRVLAGMEKPSVVVRPSPVLYKLPPGSSAGSDVGNRNGDAQEGRGSETDSSEPADKENDGPSGSPGACGGRSGRSPSRLPYRSVFAVLTLDSVVVYDTHHLRPICLARGLHYAGLTDAAWSSDGRTLFVSSTDGYISVISFADGELGEVYVPPMLKYEVRVKQEDAARALATANSAASPSAVVPPCEPGQSAILVAPPAKKARMGDTPSSAPFGPASVTPTAGDGAELGAAGKRKVGGKKRVVPTLLTSGEAKSDDGVQRGVTDLTLEETKVVGSRNAGNGNSSASDTVAPTMATTINVLEPKKKKKKRVQPMLVVNQ